MIKMLFDWMDDYIRKGNDIIFKTMKIDTSDLYPEWFRKFIRWYAYKFTFIVLGISSFLVYIYIMLRVYNRYGLDRVIVVGLAVIVFQVRSLNKNLPKLIKELARKDDTKNAQGSGKQ